MQTFEIQTVPGSSMLAESLGVMSESDLRMLLPGFGMNYNSIKDEWDLAGVNKDAESKALPYWDQQTLDAMHTVGFRLYRDPNVQTAIETLIAFVVWKGWSYSINSRAGEDLPKLKTLKETHADIIETVSLGSVSGWNELQQESYRRFLRDGEYFRRWWVRDDRLQVRFIEVFDIRQPPSKDKIVNFDNLPEAVLSQFGPAADEVPGELGIVSVEDDAATVLGYWVRVDKDEEQYRFTRAELVQHAKCNVDFNDPHGVPAFYDVVCPAHRSSEVDEAMNELAIKQSKYAVVHKHRATNRLEAIRGLADARAREMNDQVSGAGRDATETHVKNVDIEMNGMKVNASNYIEVIQQSQRKIGGVRQIPEYMISNDANVGNRSSLQSATSPFSRRVSMDQQKMWYFDQILQWNAMIAILNYAEATAISLKRKTLITVTFPIAESKDPTKDADTQIKLREDGAISREEQRRRIGVDHQQMEQELKTEGGIKVSPTKAIKSTPKPPAKAKKPPAKA